MRFQYGGLHEFFGCKVMGRERVFLFLILPSLLLGATALIYFVMTADHRPVSHVLESEERSASKMPPLIPAELMRSLGEAERMEKTAAAGDSPDAFQSPCEAFEKISASNPESDRAWGGLGRCLNARQKYPEALRALNKACRLNIMAAEHFSARGTTRRALGDLRGALADYGDALRLKPGDPMVSNLILLLALQMGDDGLYTQKLNVIARSLTAPPDATWVIAATASEMRAGNFELAASLLRQARQLLEQKQIQTLLNDPVFSDHRGKDFLDKVKSGAFTGS